MKLMFGTVWSSSPDKGTVRVEFAEDGITTAELPYLVTGGGDNKSIYPLPTGTQVACIMDGHCEYGVVLGAIYSDETVPDGGSDDKFRMVFKDGTSIEYDTADHRLTTMIGDSEFQVSESGFTIKRGGESLFTLLDDVLTAIQAETHTTSTGPSGPPVNIADFAAIAARLPNLFEG
jgi:phage baseplate assembly protein V